MSNAVEMRKVKENIEMGDKKSDAKGVSPHLFKGVSPHLFQYSFGARFGLMRA